MGPLLGMLLDTPAVSIFDAAKEKEVRDSIGLTLGASFFGTLFFAIAAIPFAYLLARKEFRFKRLISGIIDIPVVIPHSAAGIAILGFVSRDSIIGGAADSMGFSLVGHPIGIAIAMAFVSLPYLINAARNGFEAVPVRLEKAALNLGASSFKMFFSISLPLAWRNILSGLIMMFARGMSEFGAVVIIAYHPMTTPVMIFERFGAFGLKYAQPVAIIFIAISLIVFIFLRWLSGKNIHA
ncbi:MAG: molybdenum ABC transporter permease [Bacteroidetes bacterium]|nr:MAG: molybdenum ABC transporter permease [Bacteroidota bacterium]